MTSTPSGAAPGIVVIPKVPGISPEVPGFSEHLIDAGFTVAMPSLFGTPGKPVSAGYALGTIALCRQGDARLRSRRRATDLAVSARPGRGPQRPHARTGVGFVGMCFTGGFALATAVDGSVLASVMSQPSVPFPLGTARKRDLGLFPAETATVTRHTKDGLCLLGLKFSNDKALSPARFKNYARAFRRCFRDDRARLVQGQRRRL